MPIQPNAQFVERASIGYLVFKQKKKVSSAAQRRPESRSKRRASRPIAKPLPAVNLIGTRKAIASVNKVSVMSALSVFNQLSTPQIEFFTNLPPHLESITHSLSGLIPTPIDQPQFSKVILNLSAAVLSFSDHEPHLRELGKELIQQCRELAAFAQGESQFDRTAFAQIEGRIGDYPAWALCMRLAPSQLGISVPLGAEVWLALLEGRQLRKDYVSHLRRDLELLPAPDTPCDINSDDLMSLEFGKRWQKTFEQIRKRLSQKLACDPATTSSTKTLISAPADEHLRHILGAKASTTAKKRSAVSTRHTLTSEQFRVYEADLQRRLGARQTGSLCEALSILTGLYAHGVMGLSIGRGPLTGEILVLDIEGGYLYVALDVILKRKMSSSQMPSIYAPSEENYRVPLPREVLAPLEELLARWRAEPGSQEFRCRLVDILPQADRDHRPANGQSAIEDEDTYAPGFEPTLARARNTVANEAVAAGLSRLHLACARLEFGQVSKARPWYVRVQATEFETQWRAFLEGMGWTFATTAEAVDHAFGSPYVVTDKALLDIWNFYQDRVNAIPKGNNMGAERLRLFHNAFADQTAAALSFLLGLRASTHYNLSAAALSGGVDFTHIDDKGTSTLGTRVGIVCKFACAVLANWVAHCESLLARYAHDRVFSSGSSGRSIISRLQHIVEGQDVGLLFKIFPDGIRNVSSQSTWGGLPPALRCEANAGRHYWATHLHARGCSDNAVDVFLRHINTGTSPTSAYSTQSIEALVSQVASFQDRKLAELGLTLPVGLRAAR